MSAHRSSLFNGVTATLLYVIGALLSAAFLAGFYLPLRAAVVTMYAITFGGILLVRAGGLSILSRMMLLLFFMPFSATAGFLLDRNFVWWDTPAATRLIQDEEVSRIMLTTGVIGLIGLLAGIFAGAAAGVGRKRATGRNGGRVFGPVVFTLTTTVALFFSWLSAPRTTIMEAAYASAGTGGIASSFNFNASYMVSYILIDLLFIDAERSLHGRKWKFAQIGVTMAFIVVYLQLLRGDRESIGLIASILALYITSESGRKMRVRVRDQFKVQWQRVRKLIIPGIIVVVAFQVIGVIRSRDDVTEVQRAYAERFKTAATANTWTCALLTNLGTAEQYRRGDAFLYGRTYLEYALSLPPGFLTKMIGIERPIEGTHGPAWWFVGLSGGGIHFSLVPFKNFGPFGMALFMAAVGFLVARLDANSRRGMWPRLLWAAFMANSFFWVWYGDMYIVRGVMIAAIAYFAYTATLYMTQPVIGAHRQQAVTTTV